MPAMVVLGARNRGGAILDHFLERGWDGAAVARSDSTLAAVRARGALALSADASDPAELADALARAREELGGLHLVVNALSAAGGGGTLVQVTGGSSRRAIPGRGPWAAGAFACRALVQAAAQELREEGIHVAILAVDATIESPKTEAFTRGMPRVALASMEAVARAVEFLAGQDVRGMSHEMVVTPAGDRW